MALSPRGLACHCTLADSRQDSELGDIYSDAGDQAKVVHVATQVGTTQVGAVRKTLTPTDSELS